MSNNKGVILPGRAREIIYNVNKVFTNEKLRANVLLHNLNLAKMQRENSDGITISHKLFDEITEFLKLNVKVTERVVLSTGVNKNTVTRIKREGSEAEAAGTCRISTPVRKPRGKAVVLDNLDLNTLSKIITRLYKSDKDVPSLTKILTKARNDLNFQGSKATLRRIMVGQLGYKFTRGQNLSKQITIIRPHITGGSSSDEDIETEYLEPEIEDFDLQNITLNGETKIT